MQVSYVTILQDYSSIATGEHCTKQPSPTILITQLNSVFKKKKKSNIQAKFCFVHIMKVSTRIWLKSDFIYQQMWVIFMPCWAETRKLFPPSIICGSILKYVFPSSSVKRLVSVESLCTTFQNLSPLVRLQLCKLSEATISHGHTQTLYTFDSIHLVLYIYVLCLRLYWLHIIRPPELANLRPGDCSTNTGITFHCR